jgi:hypothetical protein
MVLTAWLCYPEEHAMRKTEPKITLSIEGRKVTLTMEGGVPPAIAQAIPDFVASALKQSNVLQTTPDKPEPTLLEADSWTVREKLRYAVLRYCRHGWFTSRDAKEIYDRTYHPAIPLATVCTYLARMSADASLTRRGSAARREYRVNVEELADEIASVLASKT